MVDTGTLFFEENITIIESIFQVEFEKQENNIANFIKANLKIRMDEIKKSQDEMKRSIRPKTKHWIYRKRPRKRK